MIFLMKHHGDIEQNREQRKFAVREIRKIRAKVWYWRTSALSGKRSGYAIEKYIEPYSKRKIRDKDFGFERTITNNKWPRYARGTCPNFSLVVRTEEDVPGTRAIFEHRIWKVLEEISDPWRLGLMDWPELERPQILNAIFHSGPNPLRFGKVGALAKQVRKNLGGPDPLGAIADVLSALGASRRCIVLVESILLDRLLAIAVLTLCADQKWHKAGVSLFQYLTSSVFCLHSTWIFGDDVAAYTAGASASFESSGRRGGPSSLKSIFDQFATQRLTTLEEARAEAGVRVSDMRA